VEDVVKPVKLAGPLDAADIVRSLHDADDFLVPARVGAIVAGVLFGEVVAETTEPDLVFGLEDSSRQVFGVLARSPFKMEGNSLG
jgi:hypothetical protein